MRLRPRLASVVGAVVVLWGLAIGLAALHDNSFLTHVATGRLILDHGVPHTDPYSFTVPGRPWVVESWLASVLYGVVDRVGGGHGLVLLHGALSALLAAEVWMLTRPARTLFGRVVAAVAALVVGTAEWSPRPLLLALVLLGVVVLMAESEAGPPWLLAPVLWLWVNVHGSFVIGVGYLFVRMLGRRLAGAPQGRLPPLTAYALGGTLLGAANPFGFALLGHPLLAVTEHANFAHVVEWQSPSFADPANAVFLGAALLTLVLLVARQGGIEDALVVGVALAGAALAARDVAVASLLVIAPMARGLRGLGTVRGGQGGAAAWAGGALAAALGIALAVASTTAPAYDLQDRYPVAAVTELQRAGIVPGRLAAPDYVGNYLEWRFGAKASVFFDDRVDMYPTSLVDASETLLRGSAGWQQVLARYDVRAVLWPAQGPLAGLVSADPAWRVVYRSGRWLAAVRAS